MKQPYSYFEPGNLSSFKRVTTVTARIEAMQGILPDVGAEVFSQWTNTKRREVQRTTTASGFKRRLGVETLLRFFYQPELWEMNCAWSAFLYSTIVKHNFLLRLWLPLSRQQKAQQVTEHGRVHDGERLRCLFWESWHLMFFKIAIIHEVVIDFLYWLKQVAVFEDCWPHSFHCCMNCAGLGSGGSTEWSWGSWPPSSSVMKKLRREKIRRLFLCVRGIFPLDLGRPNSMRPLATQSCRQVSSGCHGIEEWLECIGCRKSSQILWNLVKPCPFSARLLESYAAHFYTHTDVYVIYLTTLFTTSKPKSKVSIQGFIENVSFE